MNCSENVLYFRQTVESSNNWDEICISNSFLMNLKVIPMSIPNECGKTINDRELNKIISIIDNLEKHSGP